jgi:hypothetical protein
VKHEPLLLPTQLSDSAGFLGGLRLVKPLRRLALVARLRGSAFWALAGCIGPAAVRLSGGTGGRVPFASPAMARLISRRVLAVAFAGTSVLSFSSNMVRIRICVAA